MSDELKQAVIDFFLADHWLHEIGCQRCDYDNQYVECVCNENIARMQDAREALRKFVALDLESQAHKEEQHGS
ncbi:MAG: hypothetical protein ACYTEQ_01020 [Planctomycetota bacterium]|jgi:hypothetical protein